MVWQISEPPSTEQRTSVSDPGVCMHFCCGVGLAAVKHTSQSSYQDQDALMGIVNRRPTADRLPAAMLVTIHLLREVCQERIATKVLRHHAGWQEGIRAHAATRPVPLE